MLPSQVPRKGKVSLQLVMGTLDAPPLPAVPPEAALLPPVGPVLLPPVAFVGLLPPVAIVAPLPPVASVAPFPPVASSAPLAPVVSQPLVRPPHPVQQMTDARPKVKGKIRMPN